MSQQDSLLKADLRKLAAQLVRKDSGVTLNDYGGVLAHHRQFGDRLGLQCSKWYHDREKRILETGITEAFKKADLLERILATEDIEVPRTEVINVAESGTAKADANGDAFPSSSFSTHSTSTDAIPLDNQPAADADGVFTAAPPQEADAG